MKETIATEPLNLDHWFDLLQQMTASDEIYITLRVKGHSVHLISAGVRPVSEQVWPQDEIPPHCKPEKADYLG